MSNFSIHPEWLHETAVLPIAQMPKSLSMIVKESSSSFNDEQWAAIKDLTGRSIINAGAGTGKSTCLIARMQRITKLYPDAHVLMLSFTRKSALELRMRIGNRSNVQVSTFHSLAFQILHCNGFADFRIDLNAGSQQAIIQRCIEQQDTTPDEVIQSLRSPKTASKATMAVQKTYLQYLFQHKILTFDTMQVFAHHLLSTNTNILHRWQHFYNFVLVDEYQDVDVLQAELLEMLSQKTQNLCVVGDSRQSIYSFRGALPEAMKKFHSDAVYDLTVNYRCNPAILGLANKIMPKEKPLIPAYCEQDTVYPEYLAAENSADEAIQIVRTIQKLHKDGIRYKNMAILYRSSSLASDVLEELLQKKIPAVSLAQNFLIHQSMPATGLIRLLRAAIEPERTDAIKAILPILYLKKTEFKKIKDIAIKRNLSFLNAARELSLPFFHQEYIASLTYAIEKSKNLSPQEAAELLLAKGYGKYIGQDMLPNVEVLIAKLKDYASIPAYLAHIHELQTRFVAMKKLTATHTDYLQLMSIHAAKGMEFHTVFLPGCYDGALPSSHDDADLDEERRLLYVAVTRAKERLYISYPKSRENSIEPNQASRFLREAFSMK